MSFYKRFTRYLSIIYELIPNIYNIQHTKDNALKRGFIRSLPQLAGHACLN